jgi:V/A-type H+-transporting ATPase subunit E
MENKIVELTDKIFKEGVEKGEQQAREIVDNAKSQAEKIIADAKKEAEKIVGDAQSRAEEQKRTVANEIKLSGQQALASIRQQILDVVTAKAVDSGVKNALDDPAAVKDLILAIAQNWKSGEAKQMSLEVLLPEQKRETLEKSLVAALQKALKGGITVSFSHALSGGFQIGPSDGSYKVSLTENDFIEFFKEYLRPKARTYLFDK